MSFLFILLIINYLPAFEVIYHSLLDENCKVNGYICSMVLLTGVAILRFLAKLCFMDGRKEERAPVSHTEVCSAAAGPGAVG